MKSQDIFLLLKLVSLAKGKVERGPLSAAETNDARSFIDDDSDENDLELTRKIDAISYIDAREGELDIYSVRMLSQQTGISKSEVSNALNRCYRSGLAKHGRAGLAPTVNVRSLEEFLIYGIRYVFPVEMRELSRGLPTGMTAPIFSGELRSAGDQLPVWADPKGDTAGFAVTPLFKTVPLAARRDPKLYAFLALVDSIRLGQARERNLAAKKLQQLLRG